MSEPSQSLNLLSKEFHEKLTILHDIVRKQPSLLYLIGGIIFSLLLAYVIFRLVFRRKPKVSKSKPKKRSTEKKKPSTQEPISSAKQSSEVDLNTASNRPGLVSKKGVSRGAEPASSHESVSKTTKIGKKVTNLEVSATTGDDLSEGPWVIVSEGKKDKKPTSTKSQNASKKTTEPAPNQTKSSKVKSSAAPVVRPPLERVSDVTQAFRAEDEDTEEEWREVRFSRKGGKYKRAE